MRRLSNDFLGGRDRLMAFFSLRDYWCAHRPVCSQTDWRTMMRRLSNYLVQGRERLMAFISSRDYLCAHRPVRSQEEMTTMRRLWNDLVQGHEPLTAIAHEPTCVLNGLCEARKKWRYRDYLSQNSDSANPDIANSGRNDNAKTASHKIQIVQIQIEMTIQGLF